MKKRWIVFAIVMSIIFSMNFGFFSSIVSASETYAWVLVDTYEYPIPSSYNEEYYSASLSGNTIELQTAWPYGLGAYASRDYDNPTDMHAIYTWTNPPSIIKPDETVSIELSQEVISNQNGNYSIGYTAFMSLDMAEIELGYATSSKVNAKAVYQDGSTANRLGIGNGYDEQAQDDFAADMSLKFFGEGSEGKQYAITIGVYGGSPGSVGVKYIYEWKKLDSSATSATSNTASGNNAEAFQSGARLMWSPAQGIGYRLFRSTSQSDLGISVTDFYLTSTSFADVNVEPNTTYYYTVKPVLAEANPFQGIEEKLGGAVATFTVRTGETVYKPGSFKHFIILKLNDPNMSVDGINQEVDPGRGTTPVTLSNRTMVPIRAIVEAMGGTVEWQDSTKKITLIARGNVVEMWLNKKEIIVNGVSKKMDVEPISKNGRTFVPVRFGAENLNCNVDWINSTKEAVVVYEE